MPSGKESLADKGRVLEFVLDRVMNFFQLSTVTNVW